MKIRNPQLTNDARAVLLEALLRDEQVTRAVAFMRNGLRHAQFARGLERLQLMNLADAKTGFLTDEGERIARQLQENEARLVAGIPFEERGAAILLRGGKDTAELEDEGWYETTIKGEPFFTNGKILMRGRAPGASKMDRNPSDEGVHKAWYEQLAGNPKPVVPVAYSEIAGYKSRTRLVWFSDRSALQCELYNFIITSFAPVVWTHSTERIYRGFEYGLNAYHNGRRVACTGSNSSTPSETVERLIAEAAKKQQEEEKPVVKVDEPRRDELAPVVKLCDFDGRKAVQPSLLDSLQAAA